MLITGLVSIISLCVIALSFVKPHLILILYIWINVVTPNYIKTFSKAIPVSAFITLFAIIISIIFIRKYKAKLYSKTYLLILLFLIWITLTTTWAHVSPSVAWRKWDWAFQAVLIALILPLGLRERRSVEAALLVFTLTLCSHLIAAGLKGILGGAGYGRVLSYVGNQSGYGESSTLSMLSVAVIPLAYAVVYHSSFIKNPLLRKTGFLAIGLFAVSTTFSTFARTGLVSLGAFLAALLRSNIARAFLLLTGFLLYEIIVAFADQILPEAWAHRMGTIANYSEEKSAAGRILVWGWTLEFVTRHPFGGGFRVDNTNQLLNDTLGKAFHSIYFEVLGEHGIIGFALFVTILLSVVIKLYQMERRFSLLENFAWYVRMARALRLALLVIMTGGAFVGVAFQPFIYILLGISLSFLNIAREQLKPTSPKLN